MFVPKSPKRADFCGSPPCPLCFDWVEDIPVVVKKEEEIAPPAPPVKVDGIVKMGITILGREPTKQELPALKRAAETIHEQNRLRLKDEADAEQRLKDADREQHITMTVEAVIAAKVKERNAGPGRKTLNTVNIDDMDPQKVKEACGLEAPVDAELLARENAKTIKTEKQKFIEQMVTQQRGKW